MDNKIKPVIPVFLDGDELYNLIDFIEVEFIDSIRRDDMIDNIEYLRTIMVALTKLKEAFATIKIDKEE